MAVVSTERPYTSDAGDSVPWFAFQGSAGSNSGDLRRSGDGGRREGDGGEDSSAMPPPSSSPSSTLIEVVARRVAVEGMSDGREGSGKALPGEATIMKALRDAVLRRGDMAGYETFFLK